MRYCYKLDSQSLLSSRYFSLFSTYQAHSRGNANYSVITCRVYTATRHDIKILLSGLNITVIATVLPVNIYNEEI